MNGNQRSRLTTGRKQAPLGHPLQAFTPWQRWRWKKPIPYHELLVPVPAHASTRGSPYHASEDQSGEHSVRWYWHENHGFPNGIPRGIAKLRRVCYSANAKKAMFIITIPYSLPSGLSSPVALRPVSPWSSDSGDKTRSL